MNKTTNLIINEKFRDLIPPLTSEEFRLLEESILKYGCIDPICVWNQTIIDGHNRYNICTKYNLDFSIKMLNFKLEEEVKDWICANQLGRRNISDETKRYLIGKRYEMEKIIFNNSNPNGKNQYSKKYSERETSNNRYRNRTPVTAIKLGKEYNIATRTVLSYATYSKAIDFLNEKEPELTQKILNGDIKISQKQVVKISKLSPKFKNKIQNYLNDGNNTNYIAKKVNSTGEKKYKIKEMPEYDPNAEIVSLTLTIPSWIESLDRVLALSKYKKASVDAKKKLKKELHSLKCSIGTMLLALEE